MGARNQARPRGCAALTVRRDLGGTLPHAGLLSYLKAGDHIVSARALFGACRYIVETLCPRFGIASTLIDGTDLDAWRKAMRPNTKMIFFETPSNPTLELVDIEAVSKIAHAAGAL